MHFSKFPVYVCALAICGTLALHAEDTPAQAAARKAMLQKMEELSRSAPVAQQSSAQYAAQDNAAQAKARVALNQKLAERGTPVNAAAPTPSAVAPVIDNGNAAKVTSAAPVAPVAPAALTKADKLQQILSLYKTDKMTAKEYHERRAAIIAEP